MKLSFLRQIGQAAFQFLASFGRIAFFTASAVRWTLQPPYYGRQIGRQIIDIGYYSLPVVGLIVLTALTLTAIAAWGVTVSVTAVAMVTLLEAGTLVVIIGFSAERYGPAFRHAVSHSS